jgi:hypothetical protein
MRATASDNASELTQLCVPLCAASTLNGHNVYVSDGPRLLPLCVAVADVSGKRRRQLWTAWDDTDGRTGHWGRLHRAGFTIHALANLDQHAEYRRPLPYRYEQRQIAGAPRGYVEQVAVDPKNRHRNRSTRCADPPAAEWPYDHPTANKELTRITKCDTVSGVATTRRPLGGQEKS